MSITVRQLAELVEGKLTGDGSVLIHAARPLQEAGPGHITFIEGEKQARLLPACKASAVIARPGHAVNGTPCIEVTDPLNAFLAVFQFLHGQPGPPASGIDPRACIHPTAQLGAGVSLDPFVSIGSGTTIGDRCRFYAGVVVGRNCRIGSDVVVYPHVVIYDGSTLGDRVMIHANAVIGADGFGYRFQEGRHLKVPQLGTVEIGDDVEIGACTTIDRGTFQPTRIGAGTKIDNLVQVAHNCHLGRHNLVVGQVGIAGSCTTGDYVVMAGQVGVADHVHIGDRAVLGAKAGVMKDVPAGQSVLGAPAQPEREAKVMLLTLERLPELHRDVRRIKKALNLE